MRRIITGLISCIFVASFVFSCKEKEIQKDVAIPLLRLDIPVKELPETKLSDVIAEYKPVKLEFTPQSMIGSVRKVIVHDGLMYILDMFGAKAVVVFDLSGKFVRSIGSVGNGPGQYLMPQDFVLDTVKNEIEILGNRKVNRFSFSGEFLNCLKLNYTAINFQKREDGYVFAITGKEDYKVAITDLQGNIKKQFVPTNKDYVSGVAFNCLLPLESNQLMFRPLRRDILYALGDTAAYPARIIDFGKYKFKLDEYLKLSPRDRMTYVIQSKEKEQCIIKTYFENSKYINLGYSMKGIYYDYILNKSTGQFVHYGGETLIDDVLWQNASRRIVGVDREYFYQLVELYQYKSTKQLRKFLETYTDDEDYIQEILHETSNPMILIVKYKV
ncbi:6-bladed beta-propeller [Puteibacter caeruleilacunae]|nr:6-bladed beta-propeller [Puteibacter caeruleilacunae]